jgi:surfactin synthase thioesterase subunit
MELAEQLDPKPAAGDAGGRPGASRSPWIGVQTLKPGADLKLIAFHHAGGNAGFFHPWAKHLERLDWLEFVAVQLPGRGRRLSEAPMQDLSALLQAVDDGVAPLLDRPYVLFGFSMGAMLAFELALRQARRGRAPAALVLAGRGAPRTAAARPGAVSRDETLRRLRRLGGTDPALLEAGPFLEVYMRTFEADFAVADAHFCARPERLDCPLHIWGGADDPEVSIERLYRWDGFAGRQFSCRLFLGDHFFLRTSQEAVFENLHRILEAARTTQ